MGINKYVKRPVIVEALQYKGDNINDVLRFCVGNCLYKDNVLYINTLEGRLRIDKGDYIIKGTEGEFYPCKTGIFEKIYRRVSR